MKLNFVEIRERVSLLDAVQFLGLEMKPEAGGNTFRGQCPRCQTNNTRALSITPSRGRFGCFARGKQNAPHGDVIEFVAHVRSVSQRDAAELLAQHFGLPNGQPTVPQRPEAGTNPPTPKPGIASVRSNLQFDHPNVLKWFGVDPKAAEAMGIGWRQSGGSLAGRVNKPCYLPTGELVSYMGYNPDKDPPIKFGTIILPP